MSDEKVYFGEFPKWLRLTVLPWYLWAAIIATAVWATSAAAADTFRLKDEHGKDVIVLVLHETECVSKEVREYLYDNLLDDRRFKKAHLEWKGETFGACWVEINGQVVPIGSDKEPIRPIPRAAFKDEAV